MNKSDLKQISKLLDDKLAPISQKLDQHGKILRNHDNKLDNQERKLDNQERKLDNHQRLLEDHGNILRNHSKILKNHSRILHVLNRDQKTILNMLDSEQMRQRRAIRRIEDHLGLPPIV